MTSEVEEVGLTPEENPHPGARYDLHCGECGAPMELRMSSKFDRPFYGCSRWPECDGTHGAHADGAPKGFPANKATRKARIRAHMIFDQVWKRRLVRSRSAAYNWMRQELGLPRSQAHIAMFSISQCEALIKSVYKAFPSLQTRYSRLMFHDDR